MKTLKSLWLGAVCAVLMGCAVAAPPPAIPTPSPAPTTQSTATTAPTATPVPKPTLTPDATPDARPAIDTPAWFNSATMYQIFPRSFYDTNGDGIGDLNGIREKLDYIQSIGVNTIWITPHYPATTYHGYDVADYTGVHPDFGTLDDFKALLAEMKLRDMKLLIDYVANHSSNAHPFFKDAYANPASPYTTWYRFENAGNTAYASFAGVPELPVWNHDNPEVRQYLIDAALFWLDLGVNGLRADVAKGPPLAFWEALREQVKAKHPDAVLLGEVWDGNVVLLRQYFESGFDALFDFPWYLSFSGGENTNGAGVLNGVDDPRVLFTPLRAMQQVYPRGAQVVRFPSNHDTNRVASAAMEDGARMRLAASIAMLAPGIPIVYYGEEIGMRGIKGPAPDYDKFRREPMDWFASEQGAGMTTWFKPDNRNNQPNDGVSVEEQDNDEASLLNHYRELSKLRAEHPALMGGEFQLMQQVEGCASCLGLWRWAEGEVAALFFNFGPAEHAITFNAAAQSPMPLLGNASFILGNSNSMDGLLIKPWSAIVMVWR
jgi:glycosidase